MPSSLDPEPCIFRRLLSKLKRGIKGNDLISTDNRTRVPLEDFINGHTHEDERELIGNVLDLRDLTAADVMTPRVNIIGVPLDVSHEDLLQTFVHSRHKRIVVYGETLDEVQGMIEWFDILAWQLSKTTFVLNQYIKPVLFISPTMKTLDLIIEMREKGIHMAIVVDEYGGVDGLLTFADLVEEIIGDIRDANFHLHPELTRRADGTIIADGRVDLEKFSDLYGIDLAHDGTEENVETIGGLVSSLAGHVPVRGEVVPHPSKPVEFEVLEADPRRIKRLLVKLLRQPQEE